MTETYTVNEVTRDGLYTRYWHWYNDEVLMITCANPVTGDKRHSSGQFVLVEPGYASHTMLKGLSESVIALHENIVASAAHIKGGGVYEAQITADGTHRGYKERYPEQLQRFWDNEFSTLDYVLRQISSSAVRPTRFSTWSFTDVIRHSSSSARILSVVRLNT